MLVTSWVGSIQRLLRRLGEVVVVSASFATRSRDHVEVKNEHVQVHLDLLRWISDLDLRIPATGQPYFSKQFTLPMIGRRHSPDPICGHLAHKRIGILSAYVIALRLPDELVAFDLPLRKIEPGFRPLEFLIKIGQVDVVARELSRGEFSASTCEGEVQDWSSVERTWRGSCSERGGQKS